MRERERDRPIGGIKLNRVCNPFWLVLVESTIRELLRAAFHPNHFLINYSRASGSSSRTVRKLAVLSKRSPTNEILIHCFETRWTDKEKIIQEIWKVSRNWNFKRWKFSSTFNCSGIKIFIRVYASFSFFLSFFSNFREKKNLNPLVSVGRAAEESRVYLFNRIFFNGEGKIFNKLGNVSRKKPARFTDGNRAKYYFHKLARYGGSFFTWLVRIYSTTVAGNRGKVLGRRENEGRLLVPEMGSAFSPDHRKIWCFEAYTYACVYIYIHIYVSQCQPRNVYSDRIRISVCVNASTSSRRDTFVHTMKPAPALDSIKLRWKCGANGLRELAFTATSRHLFSWI